MGMRLLTRFPNQWAFCGQRLIFHDIRPAPRNIVTSAASNVTSVCNSLRDGALHVVSNTVGNMILDVMPRM